MNTSIWVHLANKPSINYVIPFDPPPYLFKSKYRFRNQAKIVIIWPPPTNLKVRKSRKQLMVSSRRSVPNFSKKQTKNLYPEPLSFRKYSGSGYWFLVCFLEELRAPLSPFKIVWPLCKPKNSLICTERNLYFSGPLKVIT